ncbi:MAG: radical SAM protein [Bacilli bacterium]|nr:radical SAM protein [Bacilli bacterium]
MEKLTYTDFINSLLKKTKDTNQLLYATIELTNACNFKCKHCYLGSKKDFKFINKNELFKLLDELKKLGCISLILTGGEPLLHPDFKEIYTYAKKKGFLITLFTNGSLLDDDIVNLLKLYKPAMIEISLYGTNKTTYKRFTSRDFNFDKLKDNIKKLRDNNIRVRFKTVLLKQTYNQIDKMNKIAKELNCDFRWDYYVINSLTDNNDIINSTKLNEDEIISKILKDKDKYDLFKTTLHTNFEKNDRLFKCEAGKNSIYISSNLLLSICVIAREPYYNLKTGNLQDGIDKVREFGCQKMPNTCKCSKCENIDICRYCPSKFKIANNDYCKPIEKYCNIASKMKKIISIEEKIIIKELSKDEVLNNLDIMFDIISSNMENIIDTGNTKEENYKMWKDAMLDELKEKNKKWIGAFIDNKLIGYFLYKINPNNINLDEIQIIKKHQKDKCTFPKLFTYLLKDENIKDNYTVTTYVNKNNDKSKAIVKKFGFKILEERKNGNKYITKFKLLKDKLSKYAIN